MNDNDIKRISRLTAILTQLQTKRVITSTAMTEKFSVSVRTIYRDIRASRSSNISKILFRDPDGNLINFFTPVTPEATKKFS